MITPNLFLICVAIYLWISGTLDIVLAIIGSEKTVRPRYGIVEGIAGLIMLGIAVVMVVL